MALNQLTITKKITLLGSSIALIVAALIGATAIYSAKQIIEQRMIESELPSKLQAIDNYITHDINQMISAAEQLSSNEFVLEWARSGNTDDKTLLKELNRLVKQYDLATASWANRETAQYWNQDGFLRVLTQEQDGWFFAFTKTAQPFSISIYQESPTDVKMFVNHQQTNGIGLAGLAKSIDDMQAMLKRFQIEKTGFVFVADKNGLIQLHKDENKVAKAKLDDVYKTGITRTLLTQSDFNLQEIDLNGEATLVAASPIQNTDLFVIAQVPKHEVFSSIQVLQWQIISFAIVIALIASFAGLVLARTLSSPLSKMAELFTRLGSGDANLAYRLPASEQPELANLSAGFNQFISKIETAISQVAQESSEIRQSAAHVFKQAQKNSEALDNQKEQTISVAAAINEMGATVQEIASSAANTAKLTENSKQNTEQSHTQVTQSKEAIIELACDIDNITEQVNELANKTQAIASIVDSIRGISEQTNLLALNAAIESARAGEHGRGFAVVADEVRKLARQTQGSLDDINNQLNRLSENSTMVSEQISALANDAELQTQNAQELKRNSEGVADNAQDANKVAFDAMELAKQQNALLENFSQSMQSMKGQVSESNSLVSDIQHRLQEQMHTIKTSLGL
ncbi:MAG: methyl-accepting chemotaxis protein [Pseudomonadota bacterium]